MRTRFMSVVLGLALAGVAAAPSIAGQSAAEKNDMHHQQVGRAKKALENALVALQASGNWGNGQKEQAIRSVESAITEVDKEMNTLEKKR